MSQKNEKGITLIALVITIIVLLILAGVTINMVLGDEGIIQNAQTAKEKNEEKTAEEIAQLAALTYRTNEKTGTGNGEITSIEEAIENALDSTYGNIENTPYVTKVDGNLLVTVGENKFFIEENGTVVKTITFKINEDEYSAEAGMTWKEWCNSEKNLNVCWIDSYDMIMPGTRYSEDGLTSWLDYFSSIGYDTHPVYANESIIPNYAYYFLSFGYED